MRGRRPDGRCAAEVRPSTSHGGEDAADGRGLRYLEWTADPDPTDDTYEVHYAFLLRSADGTVVVESDRHRCGLFARELWLGWFAQAGLDPRVVVDSFGRNGLIGRRAEAGAGS